MTAEALALSLEKILHPVIGPNRVVEVERLTGGANRETWSFDAINDEHHELILQRDRQGVERQRGACALEAELLRRARARSVPTAEVITSSEIPNPLGASFSITRRISGETIARRILRDDQWATARERFVSDCARALASVHAMDSADFDDLELEVVPDALAALRETYLALDDPHPAFDLGFRWLANNRPPPLPLCLVHGDFRLGNLIVDGGGLAAALDWEASHVGDPGEDLGWLCVRAWRFGAPLPVGGLGTHDELVAAYESAGGRSVPLATLAWWEAFGTLRWGVTCLQLGGDFRTGRAPSVEMATIGRRVVENEYDLLRLLP